MAPERRTPASLVKFVASSNEKIEEAKQRWREQRFPAVPGEMEFIPLPER